MSDVEISVYITHIVSTIGVVAGAIKNSRRGRESKKLAIEPLAQNAESRLIKTLDDGASVIKREYDAALERVGPMFSKGDGILQSPNV